jgi:hypothetical protein
MRNTGHGRGAHPPLQRASLLDGDADDARRAPPASTARPLRVRLLPPPPLPTRFSGEGELSPASLDAGGSGTLAGGSSSCRRSRSSLCIFPPPRAHFLVAPPDPRWSPAFFPVAAATICRSVDKSPAPPRSPAAPLVFSGCPRSQLPRRDARRDAQPCWSCSSFAALMSSLSCVHTSSLHM